MNDPSMAGMGGAAGSMMGNMGAKQYPSPFANIDQLQQLMRMKQGMGNSMGGMTGGSNMMNQPGGSNMMNQRYMTNQPGGSNMMNQPGVDVGGITGAPGMAWTGQRPGLGMGATQPFQPSPLMRRPFTPFQTQPFPPGMPQPGGNDPNLYANQAENEPWQNRLAQPKPGFTPSRPNMQAPMKRKSFRGIAGTTGG